MTYQLIPIEKGSGQAIPLQRPVLLIGRHQECDVRIDLPKISRRHCCFALAYDRILVRDIGSRNGVRVNGRVVQESRLAVGDEVAIGPLIFRLVAEPVQAVVSPRPTAVPSPGSPRPARIAAQAGAATPPRADLEETDLVPLDDLD
jgi:pSer/pThr/pTyr-binding forkhead associated (FHA) protein